MITRNLTLVSIVIIVSIITAICYYIDFSNANVSQSVIAFEFDANNLDNYQRDQLFQYLDKSDDQLLSKNELKLLFKQLFYSTNLNKSYVNESNEQKLFDALKLSSSDIHLSKDEFNNLWNNWIKVILKPRSALIIVDVQNDFIEENGTLPVPNAKLIIPVINELIRTINFNVIVYTYDWHPSNHCSFLENARNRLTDRKIINLNEKSIEDLHKGDVVIYEKYPNITQRLWPKHCVQDSRGAQLFKDMIIAKNSIKVSKGTDPDIDSYSAFKDNGGIHKTSLDVMLKQRDITDVYLSGVLYEYCVGRTAIDALKAGYRTAMVENGIQFADTVAKNQMKLKLIDLYANVIQSNNVLDMVNGRDRTLEMGLILTQRLYQTKH